MKPLAKQLAEAMMLHLVDAEWQAQLENQKRSKRWDRCIRRFDCTPCASPLLFITITHSVTDEQNPRR